MSIILTEFNAIVIDDDDDEWWIVLEKTIHEMELNERIFYEIDMNHRLKTSSWNHFICIYINTNYIERNNELCRCQSSKL